VTHASLRRERPEDLQPVVRRRAKSGCTVTAVDYVQALRLRKTIAREFIATAFANTDVLITATVAEPPPTYPLGMQIIGRPFKESTVLRVAYAYEQATDWHLRRPPC